MKQPKSHLAYLRLRNILSQKDVAEQLGISQVYYCKLEKTPEKISLGMACKLKKILKVETIDEIIKEKAC